MKRTPLISILLFVLVSGLMAQSISKPDPKEERRAEIEMLKKQFIEARINLSNEQAPKFWNIYNAYIAEKFKIKRQIARLQRSEFSMASKDADLARAIDKIFELRAKELEIDKKSKNKFLEVLNIRQLAELYRSEKEFFREILRKFKGKYMKDD